VRVAEVVTVKDLLFFWKRIGVAAVYRKGTVLASGVLNPTCSSRIVPQG